jgi:hypothetical protein
VELIRKNQKTLLGLDSPLDSIDCERARRHQIEDENKAVMRIAVEASAL